MQVYQKITELIGHTPLFAPPELGPESGYPARIMLKLECCNPGGSVKDRVAKAMLDAAEAEGRLKADTVIIEPTSGNTGIGLAAIAAARGYRIIITMPETMSIERQKLIRSYGAEIVLTEGSKGMRGAVEKAKELADDFESSFIPGQFVNPANWKAHYAATGPEIFDDTDGTVDIFVAGVGTGGTITGTGRFLKEKNPNIRVVAVEPASSPLLSEGKSGPHKIQGIGANFVPDVLDTGIYDEVVTITDAEALESAKEIAGRFGILVGISSGAAFKAACKLAAQEENRGKTIVALLPDTGERYLSIF